MDELTRRLKEKMRTEEHPAILAEYRAEHCALLIRHGDFAQSRTEIADLRRNFGDGTFVRVSIWLLILDGLLLFFETLSPAAASDRIRRASSLSNALKIRDLFAISNAWLAHMYSHLHFSQNSLSAMLESLRAAASSTNSLIDPWLPRLSLVLAGALQTTGEWDTANQWYERARRWSIDAGDRLSLGATIYNRLSAGISRIRVETAMGWSKIPAPRRWVTEANSVNYFHLGLAIGSLPELQTLCSARASFLENDYVTAVMHLKKLMDDASARMCRLNMHVIAAELAVCELRLGNPSSARLYAEAVDTDSIGELDLDDQLVFFANLLEINEGLPNKVFPEQTTDNFKMIQKQYLLNIEQLRSGIASIMPDFNLMLNRFEPELKKASTS